MVPIDAVHVMVAVMNKRTGVQHIRVGNENQTNYVCGRSDLLLAGFKRH